MAGNSRKENREDQEGGRGRTGRRTGKSRKEDKGDKEGGQG